MILIFDPNAMIALTITTVVSALVFLVLLVLTTLQLLHWSTLKATHKQVYTWLFFCVAVNFINAIVFMIPSPNLFCVYVQVASKICYVNMLGGVEILLCYSISLYCVFARTQPRRISMVKKLGKAVSVCYAVFFIGVEYVISPLMNVAYPFIFVMILSIVILACYEAFIVYCIYAISRELRIYVHQMQGQMSSIPNSAEVILKGLRFQFVFMFLATSLGLGISVLWTPVLTTVAITEKYVDLHEDTVSFQNCLSPHFERDFVFGKIYTSSRIINWIANTVGGAVVWSLVLRGFWKNRNQIQQVARSISPVTPVP
jgi:hypothetical protein